MVVVSVDQLERALHPTPVAVLLLLVLLLVGDVLMAGARRLGLHLRLRLCRDGGRPSGPRGMTAADEALLDGLHLQLWGLVLVFHRSSTRSSCDGGRHWYVRIGTSRCEGRRGD